MVACVDVHVMVAYQTVQSPAASMHKYRSKRSFWTTLFFLFFFIILVNSTSIITWNLGKEIWVISGLLLKFPTDLQLMLVLVMSEQPWKHFYLITILKDSLVLVESCSEGSSPPNGLINFKLVNQLQVCVQPIIFKWVFKFLPSFRQFLNGNHLLGTFNYHLLYSYL